MPRIRSIRKVEKFSRTLPEVKNSNALAIEWLKAWSNAPYRPKAPPKPDAHRDDAHVLNAAVGQQTLEVALNDHQKCGNHDRESAEDEQQGMAESAPNGTRGDRVEAQQRIQSAIQKNGR